MLEAIPANSPLAPRRPHRDRVEPRVRDALDAMLQEANPGDMGRSDYDTAWVARVPDESGARPAFPEVAAALRQMQRDDGGWSDDGHVGARLLATLASLLALTDFAPDHGDDARIARGLAFVVQHWQAAIHHPYVPIAFELLVPSLIREADARGLAVGALRDDCEAMGADKLVRVRPHVYDPRASVGFSLEFMGDELDAERARGVVDASGSISTSISATAGYARVTRDPAAIDYLAACVAQTGPDAIPYSTEAGLFGRIWSLYHLHLGGLLDAEDPRLLAMGRTIAESAGPHGVGWSTKTAYGDGDDSVLGLWMATALGFDVDWTSLRQYETDHFFLAHHGETTPAVSVNAHILSAAHRYPEHFAAGTSAKLGRFLAEQQRADGSWIDKWHISSLYPTSRSVCALLPYDGRAAARGVSWLLRTQRRDGSWGTLTHGSPEETAYAMHALHAAHQAGHQGLLGAMRRAYRYLDRPEALTEQQWPRLWIAKDLYRPAMAVRAAVLAALAQGDSLCLGAETSRA